MTLEQYIENIGKRFKLGNATEHTYRGDLQQLLESLCVGVNVTNEPQRQACGAPDYILTRHDIPVGFIEAKNIGNSDLAGDSDSGNKLQFDRYKTALSNIIFTDYLEFHLYRDGQFVIKIAIGEVKRGKISPLTTNFTPFSNLIQDFCNYTGQTIQEARQLAEMMAGKARLLSDVIELSLNSDTTQNEDSTLKEQLCAFQQILIHDITPKSFADVYAQTIAYGLFAARVHDKNLNTFSRQQAAELIPKTNPFLRKLFNYIAGPDIDDRIKWIVDSLIEIFIASDVKEILKNHGKSTQTEDPIIHFYETFLSAYDPALRKARGVWYTPQPIVGFIVRAVDHILKGKFNLINGLADYSTTIINVEANGKVEQHEVHKVQILDPATGTGTFLAETIKYVHNLFTGQQGAWNEYVETHLLPRLNGFELLMASYAMAHLKLDLLLTETGYHSTKDDRFKVYLTNSLEKHHADATTIFASWLSTEANEANHIKRDSPVMVVLGNPPYSINSSNKSEWIQSLISDYKKDLHEKKINLDDDYIKFIRLGQHYIDKNGSGVLAYISNNSFIDGITHRQMRKHLLTSFDYIYILDLHGFAKLKGIDLVAENDENVFDIQQGVSINIFIKTGEKPEGSLGSIKYFEQYGRRQEKYEFLTNHTIEQIKWKQLAPTAPYYFFVNKDFSEETSHRQGFKINDLFIDSNSGIKTDRDGLFYDSNKTHLKKRFQSLLSNNFDSSFIEKYNVKDSGSYKITYAIRNKAFKEEYIQKCLYRPFESTWIYYDPRLISRPAQKAMNHFVNHKNLGLIIGRQGQVIGHMQWNLVYCTDSLTDYNVFYRGGGYVFPLFKYAETENEPTLESTAEYTANFNLDIVNKVAEILGLKYVTERVKGRRSFSPIDLFQYIYAVLHSPSYREKYKEFLKIDFPRIPYPKNKITFWCLVKLGGDLLRAHLFESYPIGRLTTQYPVNGNNEIVKLDYHDQCVYINDSQYFMNVPEEAWNFYIGGYLPAQKWLKDRKDQVLGFDEIQHYQRIIASLIETNKIMLKIGRIEIE